MKADVVEPRYYQAILDGVAQHGPYFVIAPGLAMPHGRPEEGVKKTGFALVTLGSRVQVQVSRVDLDGRKIDFRLIRAGDGSELQTQGNGKKSSSKKRPYVHEPEDQALSEGEIEAEIHASARSSKRSTASRSKAAVSSSKTASASTAPATPDKRSRSKLSPADKSKRRKDG